MGGHERGCEYEVRRVGGLWAKVKEQLKNTRLSKRWQARIVQVCVESGLLFDCQARVWWKKDRVIGMGNFSGKCRRVVVRTCMM